MLTIGDPYGHCVGLCTPPDVFHAPVGNVECWVSVAAAFVTGSIDDAWYGNATATDSATTALGPYFR